jgi:hypothetical protein
MIIIMVVMMIMIIIIIITTAKTISVTGSGGPLGFEISKLPHFLENRFTDGGEVVSLTTQPPLPPGKFLVFISVRGSS